MTEFSTHLIKYKQQEEEFWKKSRKNQNSDEKYKDYSITTYKNRLSSNSYLKDTISKDIQPVFKIISKQTGLSQVKSLTDYLISEIKEEQHEEGLLFEDDQGDLYNNKEVNNISKSWVEDDDLSEKLESQKWKKEMMKEMRYERRKLKKIPEKDITEKEKDRIKELSSNIKKQILTKKVKNKKTGEIEEKTYNLKIRAIDTTTHCILSVGGKPDKEFATIATRKFLQDNIASKGFSYIFTRHDDTDNMHFHVIIKTKNNITDKRLRFDKSDLFMIRKEYANYLSDMGIKRVATKRLDRTEYIEKISKDIEKINNNFTWYQAQINKTPSQDTTKQKNIDIFSYRANLLSQSENIIKRVKNMSFNYKEKNIIKTDLDALKTFKKEILTVTPEEFQNMRDKTLKYLTKENQNLIKKIEELRKQKTSPQIKKRQDKYIKEINKKLLSSLKEARAQIMNNEKSNDKKIESLNLINSMIKNCRKLDKTKGLGF